MPRILPALLAYANPWHCELDKHHRANAAVPWDPKDNPGRGHVAAQRRVDDDGEIYFEFDQYEPTLAVTAAKAKTLRAAARLQADAIAKPAPSATAAEIQAAGARRAALLADAEEAVTALGSDEPDDLVLREGHQPVKLPATTYYKKAIREGALLAADLATYQTVHGHGAHFEKDLGVLTARLSRERTDAHTAHQLEAPDPKPRPAVGAGRIGMNHAHRPLSAVVQVPRGTKPEDIPALAAKVMKEVQARIAADAAKKKAAEQTPSSPQPSRQTAGPGLVSLTPAVQKGS